ncbi:MAG: preprotein translocase subunit SecE [Fibrobacter sp.]|nr:preprotein translocase subunit SecE [Fibrobacter sp.]
MQKFIQYLKDVRAEMAKVSWPTRNEVTGATTLVVALSIAVSLFVYACDQILVHVVGFFLKSGL